MAGGYIPRWFTYPQTVTHPGKDTGVCNKIGALVLQAEEIFGVGDFTAKCVRVLVEQMLTMTHHVPIQNTINLYSAQAQKVSNVIAFTSMEYLIHPKQHIPRKFCTNLNVFLGDTKKT